MKKFFVQTFRRDDATLIHVITLFVTLFLVIVAGTVLLINS